MKSNRRRRQQGGVIMYMTAMMLVMIIPVVGLAIDATVLYVDKARLQGAVDGAALAAAKALARGSDDPTQQVNAKVAAATYVMLNYPVSFFYTSSVTVNQATDITIDETIAHQRSITVTAHAVIPALFMRFLNFNSTNMVATATTVRRDVNIALVVDRSGSLALTNSCQAVIQSATNFVSKFANGRDYMSLTTFSTDTRTDFPMASNFLTAATPVPTILSNITCAGSTSSAMGLWYGYDQLVGLNQPAALNVILFFTDGKPTAVNVNMPISATSTCTNPNAGPPRWINGLYNTYTNVNQWWGLSNPTAAITTANPYGNPSSDGNNSAGCAYAASWPNNQTVTSDFQGVPAADVYGDNLNNGYQSVTLSGSYISLSDTNNASAVPMNATDAAATRIRAGAAVPAHSTMLHPGQSLTNVLIYSIGLGNAPYPISTDLLERVSNDPRSTIFNASQPTGLFVVAPTSADIDAAFSVIASEILRLAK